MGSLKRNLANNILSDGKFDATDLSGTVPASNVNNDSLTNITTFSPSLGDTIQSVASDPTPASEGDIWYNTTEGVLKGYLPIEAWSSGSNLSTARESAAGAGTQTAGLYWAGSLPGPSNLTEEYNGTGWSSGGNYGTSTRDNSGTGTQTAGLGFGGQGGAAPTFTVETYEYDGSTWTAGGNRANKIANAGGGGTQTAAIGFGGYLVPVGGFSPPGFTNLTEEYDGTSWTTGGNLSINRGSLDGTAVGTQTAGLCIGGRTDTTPGITDVEEYDGAAWTAGGSLNTGQRSQGACGIQTSALSFGGSNPSGGRNTITQGYDGSVWTTSSGSLGTATYLNNGIGASNTTALSAGGNPGSITSATEEYNKSINVTTAAAWSSGGNYPTNTGDVGSAGTRTAGLIFGGETPAPVIQSATNEYDGSVFSSGGNLVSGRSFITGFGLQTAAIGFGAAPGAIITTNTESYDGSAWTEVNNLSTARGSSGGAGTQTSGLGFGGYVPGSPSSTNVTEEWDGTSWTTGGNMGTGRRGLGGCGTQTAALSAGGFSTTFTSNVEEYNGTSWTEVNNTPYSVKEFRTVGIQTAALGSSGYLPGPAGGPANIPTTSIQYDGTNWSTNPSLSTGNNRGGQAGSTTASFVTAGALGSGITTENFDGETVAATASTITTS